MLLLQDYKIQLEKSQREANDLREQLKEYQHHPNPTEIRLQGEIVTLQTKLDTLNKDLGEEISDVRDYLAGKEQAITQQAAIISQLRSDNGLLKESALELQTLKDNIEGASNYGKEHLRITKQAEQLSADIEQALRDRAELTPLRGEVDRLGNELSQLRREQLEHHQNDLEKLDKGSKQRVELLQTNRELEGNLQDVTRHLVSARQSLTEQEFKHQELLLKEQPRERNRVEMPRGCRRLYTEVEKKPGNPSAGQGHSRALDKGKKRSF